MGKKKTNKKNNKKKTVDHGHPIRYYFCLRETQAYNQVCPSVCLSKILDIFLIFPVSCEQALSLQVYLLFYKNHFVGHFLYDTLTNQLTNQRTEKQADRHGQVTKKQQ